LFVIPAAIKAATTNAFGPGVATVLAIVAALGAAATGGFAGAAVGGLGAGAGGLTGSNFGVVGFMGSTFGAGGLGAGAAGGFGAGGLGAGAAGGLGAGAAGGLGAGAAGGLGAGAAGGLGAGGLGAGGFGAGGLGAGAAGGLGAGAAGGLGAGAAGGLDGNGFFFIFSDFLGTFFVGAFMAAASSFFALISSFTFFSGFLRDKRVSINSRCFLFFSFVFSSLKESSKSNSFLSSSMFLLIKSYNLSIEIIMESDSDTFSTGLFLDVEKRDDANSFEDGIICSFFSSFG
jgi:hypothetical protein